MLNDVSSPLSFLQTRRSARPRDLVEPGPDSAQLETILRIASRIPDHGKLHPWRFVHVTREARPAFAELLQRAYREERAEPGRLEVEANERFAHQAPTLIVALSCPIAPHKIPVWEQELSCGAACFSLLAGAHALGFTGGWVTGWAAYSDTVRDAFGTADERIAAFIFLGTSGVALEERPRPELSEIASEWNPDSA